MTVTDTATPKARELRRMRAIATGLLVLMALVFVAASLADRGGRLVWLGYVRAFAEAGMAGACADWFAVTALFRRPLGLPIPHTGVIPRNKARIGEALGGFIADNFLTEEVLDAKLKQLEVARWGGAWLARPHQARRLARRLAAMLPELIQALPRDAVRDVAGQAAMAAARSVPAAPTAGKLLEAAWNEGRSQAAIEWALDRLAEYLAANAEVIHAGVEAQTAKWIPKFVDRIIAEKITSGALQLMQEMRAPDHPWRQDIREAVEGFIARLATDPELRARGEALKLKLLADPGLQDQARAVWAGLESRLASGASEGVAERLEQVLLALGRWLDQDEAAQARLNDWARIIVRRLIAPRRAEIGRFIAQVVAGWDTKSVVDKLELQFGKDLQYIRVNGTIVGGLAGLAIHAVSQVL